MIDYPKLTEYFKHTYKCIDVYYKFPQNSEIVEIYRVMRYEGSKIYTSPTSYTYKELEGIKF